MQFIKICLLACLALSGIGCTAMMHDISISGHPKYAKLEKDWRPVDPSQSRLVVYYPRLPLAGFSFSGVGGFGYVVLWLDGVPKTLLMDQTFEVLDISPGEHGVACGGEKFDPNGVTVVRMAPGHTYFVKAVSTQFKHTPCQRMEEPDARKDLEDIKFPWGAKTTRYRGKCLAKLPATSPSARR